MPMKPRKFLGPGEFYVGRRSVVAETLVGSCVAVCLYNFKESFGAMNHFRRDRPTGETGTSVGQFGVTATEHIVSTLLKRDNDPTHYRAAIFGGAAVLKTAVGEGGIGEANVTAALDVLRAAHIRVVRQEVGGTRGRRVTFDTQTGEITCRFAGDIPRKTSRRQ
ncbi:MAG: chemotaxis protein CheD [Sedimentisphaerales bacterium]|nr:chemotaxis protein CheD [Sedimentisphaerales bacterium]